MCEPFSFSVTTFFFFSFAGDSKYKIAQEKRKKKRIQNRYYYLFRCAFIAFHARFYIYFAKYASKRKNMIALISYEWFHVLLNRSQRRDERSDHTKSFDIWIYIMLAIKVPLDYLIYYILYLLWHLWNNK